MEIVLNGKPCDVEIGVTADGLLEIKGYKGKTSIWINGKQLLLSEYATSIINEGDQVKLLRVVGGG